VAVVVAGVVLRFVATSPLWLDEALSVNVASLPLGRLREALSHDGHPPLFYALLHGWMNVFGHGDVAVRALSGVFALLALVAMYAAGRRLGGARVGIVAVALLAVNPYAVRYATEARMYSLQTLLVLVGYLLVERAIREPGLWRLAGIMLVTAALVLDHYWSFHLIAAVGVLLIGLAIRSPERRSAAVRVLVAIAIGSLAFVPWLPTFLEQARHTATPWAGATRPTALVALTLRDFGGTNPTEAQLLGFLLAVLFILGVFARPVDDWHIDIDFRTVPRTRPLALVVVLTIAFGSVAGLATRSAYAPRYAAVVFPLFILVAASAVDALRGRWARDILFGMVLLGSLAISVVNAGTDRTQAQQIATAIVRGDPNGADLGRPVVVYCPDQLGPAVDRLLPRGRFDQVVYPNLDSTVVDVPGRVDWYDYAARQDSVPPEVVAKRVLDRAGPTNGIWVVSSGSYTPPGDRCAAMLAALGRERSGKLVVPEQPTDFFEHASLMVFPPSGKGT
jgi:hypothetical protein